MKSFKVKIKGREWMINLHDDFLASRKHGECDYDKRTVDILSGQLDELDTAVHEFLHIYFEKMPHKKVRSISASLAKFLIGLGWRRS